MWNTLYLPYFKETTDFKNGVISIKDNSKTDIPDKDETNPIGDWGTFGDFIGGTLNPIIGFISIILLFATWKLTRKTLDFTKEELRNSNEILNIQQFDTIFWGLLDHLKKLEERLFENKGNLDEIYDEIFASQKYERVSLCREKILLNAELSQYFIVLYQLLKNIYVKLGHSDY